MPKDGITLALHQILVNTDNVFENIALTRMALTGGPSVRREIRGFHPKISTGLVNFHVRSTN